MLFNKIVFDPVTKRRLNHFKKITRARISLQILFVFGVFAMTAELFINNKPLLLYYNKRLYIPLFSRVLLGTEFGFDNASEVNYHKLQQKIKKSGNDWIIMPVIPYNAVEQDFENSFLDDSPKQHTHIGVAVSNRREESLNPDDYTWFPVYQINKSAIQLTADDVSYSLVLYFSEKPDGNIQTQNHERAHYVAVALIFDTKTEQQYHWQKLKSKFGIKVPEKDLYVWIKFADTDKGLLLPPYKPSLRTKHILGTDRIGRDIFARIVYGFRVTVIFAFIYNIITYGLGVGIGFTMGYYGGIIDLFFQRIIEIWELIPFIYAVMILSSLFKPGFILFIVFFALLGWTKKTWMIRVLTYKEKERGYIKAARLFGASTPRIFFRHMLPNLLPAILTSLPFSINISISAITALDYLGFGLPPPTPSWGELLATGTALFISAPWILLSVLTVLIAVLIMITFIGEGLRESFDPKHFSIYQ